MFNLLVLDIRQAHRELVNNYYALYKSQLLLLLLNNNSDIVIINYGNDNE